ncbi:MAG: Eco57I restriction-modification methylase domain-containing protein [Promethearchaeota archaeon]
MSKSNNKIEIDILKKLIKFFNSVSAEDSEMDSRYKFANSIIKELWGYKDDDFKIEHDRKDVIIYDAEQNPFIVIETKALDKANKDNIKKQLDGYTQSSTYYLVGTNISNFWIWEYNSDIKKFEIRVEIHLKSIIKDLKENNKTYEELVHGELLQNILTFYKLRKEIIQDSTQYSDFNINFHKVNINDKKGFDHLILQLDRIINLILMEYALRAFNLYFRKNKEYLKKKKEMEQKLNEISEKNDIKLLQQSLHHLNDDYKAYRDFGFNAWTIYSYRSSNDFEKNKTYFCKESIYILLNKLLFVRILEDKNIIKTQISNGGIELLRDYIQDTDQKYKGVLDFAFNNAQTYYRHFYEPGILDWLILGNGELDFILNRVLWILNQYDFSDVNRDILGKLYEKYLPSDERKELGEFYTPEPIIEYILDRVDYSGHQIRQGKILDPACGSGGFLIDACKRLIREYLLFFGKNSIDEIDPNEAKNIIGEIIDKIIGWDVNPFACHIAEMNILFQLLDLISIAQKDPAFTLPRVKIFHTDSLIKRNDINSNNNLDKFLYSPAKIQVYTDEQNLIQKMKGLKYDYIVGNPPYLSVKSIPSNLFTKYKKSFSSVAKGRTDLYILFQKLGIDLLKNEGKLGFIVSDQYLTKKAGEGIKKEILENTKLIELTDFQKFKQFEDATNYVAIIILEKCSSLDLRLQNDVAYNYIIDEVSDSLEILKKGEEIDEILSLKIKQQNFSHNMNWRFEDKIGAKILLKISEKCSKTIKDLGVSKQGLISGNDDVFIGKTELIEEEGNLQHFIPLGDIKKEILEGYLIEKEVLKPIIHGRNVKRFSQISPDKSILFYYKESKDPKKSRDYIELKIIEEKYPNCYNYLTKYKSILSKRTIERDKTYEGTDYWHKLTRVRTPQVFKKGNILTKGMNNYPNFTINDLEDLKFVGGGAGVYAILLDQEEIKKLKIDEYYILGLLNSSTSSYYYRNIGAVKRGGYYQISGYQIDRTPILIPTSDEEFKIMNEIREKSKRLYILNKDIKIKNKIIEEWKKYELISIMNSPYIKKLNFPGKIKDNEELLMEHDKNIIKTTGNGIIECDNENIAKCIYIFLKYSNWLESTTPKEDLMHLMVFNEENYYSQFLDNIKDYILEENKKNKKEIELQIEINKLLYKIFGFSKKEIELIEEKFVEPWSDNS